MSSIEHKQLQAAADDGTKHRAWMARWEREFRPRWVEWDGQFWPAPGEEPQGFSIGDRMARDNAIELNRRKTVQAAIERARR